MKEGEDSSFLAQVHHQLAIRNSSDGGIREVVQVAAEDLLVMVNCFLDTASYVWRDNGSCPGEQWFQSGRRQHRWWADMVTRLKSFAFVSL